MTSDAGALSKPACGDMRQGHTTAPELFALQSESNAGGDELKSIVARKFSYLGDMEIAMQYVNEANEVDSARELAEHHAEQAVRSIVDAMQPSEYRAALVNLAYATLTRTR